MAQDRNNYTGHNYLGIVESVCGKHWQPRLDKSGENAALHMTQQYGIPDGIARILTGRGVAAEDAAIFLEPSLRNLMPDPYILQDMEKAAERLCRACLNHEQVAIFSDYDVDGACSAALLARFLTALGIKNRIYIPDRAEEGYGPNEKALRLLAEEGASLIIAADCGTDSGAVFAAARRLGMNADIIVLDHHRTESAAGGVRSDADFIHVNPNRFDDSSDLGYLCAAGVVFMCLVAVARLLRAKNIRDIPDLLGLLDLVALATICDIMPLRGLNRAFVRTGLSVAHNQYNIGLKALAQKAGINEPLAPYHFGYVLGPRLNAGGRVGDSALGAKLLCCNDEGEAERIAAQLDSLNYGRQNIEAEQLRQALEQVEADRAAEQGASENAIFAVGDWHIGIIGLLAARLREHFSLPAFVMTEIKQGRQKGMVTGSARSINGFDIGMLVRQAVAEGLLEKGGGHKQAAGFSLKTENVPLFRAWLWQKMKNDAVYDETAYRLKIDGSVSAGGVTEELIETLSKAGPYGAGNPQPLFALPNHKLIYVQTMGKDKAHLRLILEDGHGIRLSAVLFRAANTDLGRFLQTNIGKEAHFAGTLSLNHWNGQATPRLHIVDAAEA